MSLAFPKLCRLVSYRQPLAALSTRHGLANQTRMKSSKDKTQKQETQTTRDLPPYLRQLSEDSVSIAVNVKPGSKVSISGLLGSRSQYCFNCHNTSIADYKDLEPR